MNKIKNDKTQIKSTIEIKPHIYAWSDLSSTDFSGWLKIGYTEKQTVEQRVRQSIGQTLSKPKIEWHYPAKYLSGGFFKDHDFHRYLSRKYKIPRRVGTEWFDFNPDGAPKSEDIIREFLLGKKQTGFELKQPGYKLRKEQNEAVKMTANYFIQNPNSEFLWNAKPRFGKTLTTYDLAYAMNAKNVLIVTNRPAIANSWYDDYTKFVEPKHDYLFVSTSDSLRDSETLDRKQFNEERQKRKNAGRATRLIEFMSLQDLKGSKFFGGTINKLQHIAKTEWDLLVIDEAHEGVDTFKTDIAFDNINSKNTLHLSGTPFKALANNKFLAEQIYNWSYEDEQKAKNDWHGDVGHNPYENMPTLSLFTYQLSQMITDKINTGANTAEDGGMDYAFDLNEFFETKENGIFKYESDINKFLDNLTRNKKFPFSTSELRDEIKHSFWLLNRIDSVKALAKLMKKHPVFENYEIILAVGKQEDNEKAYDKVKEAIKNNDKTITLSVGQLTTGVTIPEWTAVMMLSNITSPSLYMQAAFRAQNPWQYEIDDHIYQKENAYIFDFAPERTLIIFDEFANNLNNKTTNTTEERKTNIKELLNFFPVIAEDEEGKMVELDAEKVLTIPKSLKAHEVVRRGFMSNLLFDNISGIFAYPKQIIDILEKLPESDQGKVKQAKEHIEIPTDVEVDETGQAIPIEDIVISKTDAIFGTPIYENTITKNIEEFIKEEPSKKIAETIAKTVIADTIAPSISSINEHIDVNMKKSQETKIIKAAEIAVKEVIEKEIAQLDINVAHIEDDFKKKIEEAKDETEIAYIQEQKDKIVAETRATYIATVQEKVAEKIKEQKKEIVHEQVKKSDQKKINSAMEDVRSRLRGFARTIPSFIMAYGDRGLKLANFDTYTPAGVFAEITGITISQFKQLRDGMTIKDENGNNVEVKGLFDASTFDTSIHEFLDKKETLANYFNSEITEDIFDYIPAQKTNQIFTPKPVVKMMVDVLEQENSGIFANPDAKFVDLYTKSGLYLAELVKRLHTGLMEVIPNEQQRLEHILTKQIFGIAPSEIIQKIAQNYVYGNACNEVGAGNIKNLDVVPFIKDGTDMAKEKITEVFNNMKFDVVIGNPPYQDTSVGDSTQMPPIYHFFMDSAYEIADKSVLITPARFLFNAGATGREWNRKMLNDEHLKITYYNQKSAEVFPNTDIKGGVAVTYRDVNKKFGAIGTFTSFKELNSILNKVINSNFTSFSNIVYSASSAQFSKVLHEDYPDVKSKLSKGHENDIFSDIFKAIPEIFFMEKPSDDDEYVQILGRENNARVYKWIKRKYIKEHRTFEKYKVFVPAANGTGAIGEILSTPLIGLPLIGTTQTFIIIGDFDEEVEARNVLKYVKTKFSRTMLSVLKITQHNPPVKWSKVPLQDFTPKSDIDWSKSIPEIDQQLYAKYELDQTEIEFIETKVKEME